MSTLKLGYMGCYINDYGFSHLIDIPPQVALEWVKTNFPNTKLDALGHLEAKDLTIGGNYDTDIHKNGWLNKLFIIVGCDHEKWYALYNHGGTFSIRTKNIEYEGD